MSSTVSKRKAARRQSPTSKKRPLVTKLSNKRSTVKGKSKEPASVFDQLGFSPKESRKAQLKVKLLGSILDIYRSKGYTQVEVAALWNKPQSRVSEILTGKLHLVRIGTLIDLLESLGADIDVMVMQAG